MSQPSGWASLAVAQLIVSGSTPVVVAALGIWVARTTKRADRRAEAAARAAVNAEWTNRRAVERLIELHKEMAPLLNDLMCFFRLIGHFREIDPPQLLAHKRQLDRTFYTNRHLFSSALQDNYQGFMRLCFAQWKSASQDAKIRASATRLRLERGPAAHWDGDWDSMFEDMPDTPQLRRKQQELYDDVMNAFSADMGLSRENATAAIA